MIKEKLILTALDIASAGGGGSDSGGFDSGGFDSSGSDYSYGGESSSGSDAANLLGLSGFLMIIGSMVCTGIIIDKISKTKQDDVAGVNAARGLTLGLFGGLFAICALVGLVFDGSLQYTITGLLMMSWLWIALIIEAFGKKDYLGGENNVYMKDGSSVADEITGPLATEVQQIFTRYQADWSNLDGSRFNEYMTTSYATRAGLMIEAFQAARRRNPTTIINYNGTGLVRGSQYGAEFSGVPQYNLEGQEVSGFTAWCSAYVDDALYDTRSNTLLMDSKYNLHEKWLLKRINGRLLLDGIQQPTADLSTREGQIEAFAGQAGAFYSLDWGRMLLPQYGMIFTPESLRVGDVNNHVIGRFKDTGHATSDDTVYQLFTYSAVPYHQANRVYLVGELSVPKSYGNIAIIRRGGWLRRRPAGLQQYTFESSEFNDMYDVYASDGMALSTFELLNPAMLQTLADAPYIINIEVIDNIIYFYAELRQTDARNYASMLAVLQAAYRELKL